MSKKCINCGAELEQNARYCDECGVCQIDENINDDTKVSTKRQHSSGLSIIGCLGTIIKFILFVAIILFVISKFWGKNQISESEKKEYINGIQIVSLLDKETYEKNGNEMVTAVEKALNASVDDFYMLQDKGSIFTDKSEFEVTFDESECDAYYVGEVKDNKPHGYGVITNGYNNEEFYYIGKFKKGKVDNSYGVELENSITGTAIRYEGIVDYLAYTDKEVYAVPEDGKRVIPYDFGSIYNYYNKGADTIYENIGLSEIKVARCFPRYIGEISNNHYSGKGTSYYVNGNIKYEGEFKADAYHGEGKLYTFEGKILKEGTFKNGELKEGKYYKENEDENPIMQDEEDNMDSNYMQEDSNTEESMTSATEDSGKEMIILEDYVHYSLTADEMAEVLQIAGINISYLEEFDGYGFADGSLIMVNYDTGTSIMMEPSEDHILSICGINTEMSLEEASNELVNSYGAEDVTLPDGNAWRYNIDNTYLISLYGTPDDNQINIVFEPYYELY